MADQSTQSIVVEAPAADVMAVIADFPAYPQWVAAAKRVEVVETGGRTEVTYSITIDLSIPMLGMIKRKAEKVILDTALKELKKRVES